MISGRQELVNIYKMGDSKQTLGSKPSYIFHTKIYMAISKTIGNMFDKTNVNTYLGTHTGLILNSGVDVNKRDRIISNDNTTYEVVEVTQTPRALMLSLREVN